MKKAVLLLSAIITIVYSFGQEREHNIHLFMQQFTDGVSYFSKDVESLRKRTDFLIRKDPVLSSMVGIRQYHIYSLYPCGSYIWRIEYEDASFLFNLVYGYYTIRGNFLNRLFSKKMKYMRDRTVITDSLGNLVAYGDARSIFVPQIPLSENDDEVEIAKLFFENRIDFVFDLFQYPNTYICIRENNLFVLEAGTNGLEHSSWESFLEKKLIGQGNR